MKTKKTKQKNICSKNYFSTLYLTFFMIFIFILEQITNIKQLWILNPDLIQSQPYRLLTAIFLHADINHIFQNLFALILFGLILEHIIGTCRYLFIFFLGGLAGNISSIIFYPDAYSLGASAAIMAILGTLTIIRPKTIVYFYGPIPLILLTAIWILIDLVSIYSNDNIGHIAHLSGFATGILYGFLIKNKFSEEKEIKKRARIEITEEELDEWEKEWM